MVSFTESTDRRMPLKEIEHLAFGSRQRNITFFYDNQKLFIFSLLCYFACWTPLPMIVLVALQCCLEDDRFGCSVIVDVALNFSLFVIINKYFLMYFAVLQHNGMYFLFPNSFMVFSSSKTATFQILLEGIALISIKKTFSSFCCFAMSRRSMFLPHRLKPQSRICRALCRWKKIVYTGRDLRR